MLTSPNTQSSYGVVATAVAAAATAAIPKPAALCLRWSVWRTRPGHVLCVERLEMQTAPLLLEVEQAHAVQLMQFGKSLLAPFADAAHAVRYVISSKCVSTNPFFMTAASIVQLPHDGNKLFVSTGNHCHHQHVTLVVNVHMFDFSTMGDYTSESTHRQLWWHAIWDLMIEITRFLHCRVCQSRLPSHSPKTHSQKEIGVLIC